VARLPLLQRGFDTGMSALIVSTERFTPGDEWTSCNAGLYVVLTT